MNKFFLVIIFIFCISCSINGGLQGLYSYYSKTKSKNSQLLIKPSSSAPTCNENKSDTSKAKSEMVGRLIFFEDGVFKVSFEQIEEI